MALVTTITHQRLERDAPHKPVECTYCLVTGTDGKRYLQLDTYGSSERMIKGKKSQSIRFTPTALLKLGQIFQELDLGKQ